MQCQDVARRIPEIELVDQAAYAFHLTNRRDDVIELFAQGDSLKCHFPIVGENLNSSPMFDTMEELRTNSRCQSVIGARDICSHVSSLALVGRPCGQMPNPIASRVPLAPDRLDEYCFAFDFPNA